MTTIIIALAAYVGGYIHHRYQPDFWRGTWDRITGMFTRERF
jgi:hypothetical protein